MKRGIIFYQTSITSWEIRDKGGRKLGSIEQNGDLYCVTTPTRTETTTPGTTLDDIQRDMLARGL